MAGDNATFDRGLRKAITAPFRVVIFAAIAVVVVVAGRMLIDAFWVAQSPERLAAQHAALIGEIAATEKLPDIGGSATERALRWAIGAYEWLYVKSGTDRVLVASPKDFTEPEKVLRRGMNADAVKPHWQAMITGTQILAVRAAALPAVLPTLALLYFLAAVDGLIARWLRRAAGGRESSTIYHRSKYAHAVAATLILMVWFWSPEPVNLWQFATIMAVTGAMLLRTQLKFLKKYI